MIVDLPVFQIVNLVSPFRRTFRDRGERELNLDIQVNGLLTLALEWPLPHIKRYKLYGSHLLRIVLYLWSALVAGASPFRLDVAARSLDLGSGTDTSVAAAFVYQTVMGTIFYLVAVLAYARSWR